MVTGCMICSGFVLNTSLRSLYLSGSLWLYIMFIGVYLILYWRRYKETGPALCCALLVAFIVADYWEIPVFVYGYLGAFDGFFNRYIQHGYLVHHAYVIACFYLFKKLTNFAFTKVNKTLFIGELALSFILVAPFCYWIPFISYWLRLIPLILIGIAFYQGVGEWQPLVKRV